MRLQQLMRQRPIEEIKTLEEAIKYLESERDTSVIMFHGLKGTHYLLRQGGLNLSLTKEGILTYAQYRMNRNGHNG